MFVIDFNVSNIWTEQREKLQQELEENDSLAILTAARTRFLLSNHFIFLYYCIV
jgi:hypothetical protein